MMCQSDIFQVILPDNYNPSTKVLSLSECQLTEAKVLAAIGVAAT